MPKYDYKCPECGLVEERTRKMDDQSSEICYLCTTQEHRFIFMNRIYHPVAVSFQGGGFYASDTKKVKVSADLKP